MKNTHLLFILLVFFYTGVSGQGTLQFSNAQIVSNTAATVPSGKVWKVTSIYGNEAACVDAQNAENATWTYRKFFRTSFKVNGVEIVSAAIDYQSRYWCNSGSCTSCITNWPNDKLERTANPNILPMWLPAGTTLESGGPNTFISILEFNIIP